MDDSALYSDWMIGLGLAALVVVIAAILLILTLNAARRILSLATAALDLVVQIKENTKSIWALEQTNEVALDILQEAEEIESHAGVVAEALHQTS